MVVGTNIIIQCYFKQKRDGRQSWATLSWEQGSLLAVLRGLGGKLGIESASAVCKARTLLLENRKIKKRNRKSHLWILVLISEFKQELWIFMIKLVGEI